VKRKVMLGLAISAVCMYLALRGVDWSAMVGALRRAHYIYILPNGALIIISMWLRAVRWRYMTDPIKPGIGVHSLFASTMIGFMVNNVLPLRLGEIARPFSLSHKENLSRSAAFATIVVERVFDALSLLLVSGLLLIFAPMLINGEVSLVHAAYVALALHLVALTFLVILKVRTEASLAWLRRVGGVFPDRVRDRLVDVAAKFSTGLGVLENGRSLLAVIFWSLAIWGLVGFSNYFIFLAFDLSVPWFAPYVVLVIVSLGVMLPSAPGYVGPFQFFTVAALKIFGIPASVGLSFSLVLHAGNYLPVTLLGLYYLRREHFTLRQLEEEAA
jgi:uncharacterized protein (TIRG00374 family)